MVWCCSYRGLLVRSCWCIATLRVGFLVYSVFERSNTGTSAALPWLSDRASSSVGEASREDDQSKGHVYAFSPSLMACSFLHWPAGSF